MHGQWSFYEIMLKLYVEGRRTWVSQLLKSEGFTTCYFFSFFFSFFAFSFFLSRFFNACIPFLHTSPYLPKKSSNPSCVTMVDIFNLSPSVARSINGNVSVVFKSDKSAIFDLDEGESDLYESGISTESVKVSTSFLCEEDGTMT